jgi:hypothetical protein
MNVSHEISRLDKLTKLRYSQKILLFTEKTQQNSQATPLLTIKTTLNHRSSTLINNKYTFPEKFLGLAGLQG